jgi:hypothetical protein
MDDEGSGETVGHRPLAPQCRRGRGADSVIGFLAEGRDEGIHRRLGIPEASESVRGQDPNFGLVFPLAQDFRQATCGLVGLHLEKDLFQGLGDLEVILVFHGLNELIDRVVPACR